MSDSELAKILESQFTDDLVDDLEDLPANLVTRVLKNVSKEKLVIMVTHNPDLSKEYSTRIIKLKDGKTWQEYIADYYEGIKN